jgi:hypothetical protein
MSGLLPEIWVSDNSEEYERQSRRDDDWWDEPFGHLQLPFCVDRFRLQLRSKLTAGYSNEIRKKAASNRGGGWI